jgi:hypothetical protein
MNTSASVMNTVPFSGPLAISMIALVAVGSVVVAGFVIRDTLRQRREAHLKAMEAHPELEAFGFPTHAVAKSKSTIDTGSILRSEGYSV